METALRLKTTHRVAWMACGSLLLATATLTLSDSVNAAVVIVPSSTVYVPVQPTPFYRGYAYRTSRYYGGAGHAYHAGGYHYNRGGAYRHGDNPRNVNGGVNRRGRR